MRGVALLVVVLAFVLVLPRVADYGDVWGEVSTLDARWIAALLAVATVNVLTFAPPWSAALPGLSLRHALTVSLSSTAVANVAPGGDAVGLAMTFGMLRGWGFERARVALALVVFTVWNQLVNVVFPLLAVVLLAATGARSALLLNAALIGGAILVLVVGGAVVALRSEAGARRVGRLAQRPLAWALRTARRPPPDDLAETLAAFRTSSLGLIRRRWPALTAATIAGHLTVWIVLDVALRAVDVGADEVSLVESFAAWSLVRLLTAVPITPGGVGIVELGLTGMLVGFGGPNAEVVTAVLLYRALTFVPPIPLGLALSLTYRRAHRGGAGP